MKNECLLNILIFKKPHKCLRITGCVSNICCTLWNELYMPSYGTCSHAQTHKHGHITIICMFAHTNMKRKLPLPNFLLQGKFQFPILQDDAAGPDMHQTADEFGDGRKEGSILINLSFESAPLINTCKCSVHWVFHAFTREGTFGLKPSLRGFSATNVQPQKHRQSSNVRSTF